MSTIQKPQLVDGPHDLGSSTEEWVQDDFTLYEMLQIIEIMEKIQNDWQNGEADARSVVMAHWAAKHAVAVASTLSEKLMN